MEQRTGRFRVYRVVESVPHSNFFDTDATRLYTVYQSGYGERQARIDSLRTGDLVEATLAGNPDDSEEAWSIQSVERVGGVRMSFAVDAEMPALAEELWSEGQRHPSSIVIEEDGTPVAELHVQPRDPLPGGSFVPSVLTGLVPMEGTLSVLPSIGGPATHALFLDPDPPDADRYSRPFGVVVLFGEDADAVLTEWHDRYDVDPESDSRPTYDPYGI
ncbi:hypothetical protein NDI85_06705 [Halomicroarcula sp. S1AR25-4]|uniref:hypothetical protein n=1 Tax=Haloarcula sp. S1AR25-4 TaxID=2950538 RepID=UPI0028744CE0|nr:hypothetical protein [Halomicroarcula sp. S1AR25-4]MDS0277478.1 hypothetical protein [Halomicroarcula sp. S1AR25-4]